jgi:hypothetical protein
LWPERLALAIYPDHLAWVRAGGWRLRVLDKGAVHFDENDKSSLAGALASVLEKNGKRGRVDIVLSNRLVRYTLVSNPDNARNLTERKRLASHAFECIHGKDVSSWRIVLSHAEPGKTALAGAVDAALLDLLYETASACGTRIARLNPYLMAAFNPNRRRFSVSGMFAVAEPGRLCVAAWQDGGWAGIQQSHLDMDRIGFSAALARVRTMAGLMGNEPVWLYAAESGSGISNTEAARLLANWPAGLSPIQDSGLGGAVLGMA